MGLGEEEKKNVKHRRQRFLKTQEMDNKLVNLWSFAMTRFMGKNWYKICQCKKAKLMK